MDRVQSLTRDTSWAGFSDQESASDQGFADAKAAGRLAGDLRTKHFYVRNDLPKQHSRVTVECIHCTAIMDSRADHLRDHVLEHCKSITQENRAEALKQMEVTFKPTVGRRPPTSLSRTYI